MKILAVDQATKAGWAVTPEVSGTWNLAVLRDESAGMRLIRFRAKLKEIIALEKIEVVVYERVAGRFKSSISVSAELAGTLKVVCEDAGIQYRAFSAGEIKKHATGKGGCGKPAMIAAAEKKWPHLLIIDDNHADALWMLDLANKLYNKKFVV